MSPEKPEFEPTANVQSQPATKPPLWKNPFVLAFVAGVVFLTVIPFAQRRFLKAPPPVHTLAPWTAFTLDGATISSQTLAGTVWLANFAPDDCGEDCLKRQDTLGRAVEHLDDLKGKVIVVTIAMPGAQERLKDLASKSALWRFIGGTPEQLAPLVDGFRAGFAKWTTTDAGTTPAEFAHLPALILVDQEGAVRGFWQDDAAGRGNSINAARLLAKYGPRP